jgi:CheY-like chemotaxis protein
VKSTVLYVEDNDNNIRLVERILQRRIAVDLVVAMTGVQGLRMAQANPPRLILLDRRLPDMHGDEVLRELKAGDHTAAIPVVVLSGDAEQDHAAGVLALGADGFLSKPFDIHQFLAIVDRFCP